ncbi:MAG: hypothetical protein R3C97_13315 [Geminicoccaceae bacterium]
MSCHHPNPFTHAPFSSLHSTADGRTTPRKAVVAGGIDLFYGERLLDNWAFIFLLRSS